MEFIESRGGGGARRLLKTTPLTCISGAASLQGFHSQKAADVWKKDVWEDFQAFSQTFLKRDFPHEMKAKRART